MTSMRTLARRPLARSTPTATAFASASARTPIHMRVHQCSFMCPCHSRLLAVRGFSTDSNPSDTKPTEPASAASGSPLQRLQAFMNCENQQPLLEVITGMHSQPINESLQTVLLGSGALFLLNLPMGYIPFVTPAIETAFTVALFPHMWLGMESITNDYLPPGMRPLASLAVLGVTVVVMIMLLSFILTGPGLLNSIKAFFQRPLDEKTRKALQQAKGEH